MKRESVRPILYSFVRCPYAIRARMAIRYSGVSVELREVMLRDKPEALLTCSPKGTVPVLALPDGRIIEESLDIMAWALAINDPDRWLSENEIAIAEEGRSLISENDFEFKKYLDLYKYADRYPQYSKEHYRMQAEIFLRKLEGNLHGRQYLMGERITFADIAIMPFIRQFVGVDTNWFEKTSYIQVQRWLKSLLTSNLFTSVMTKYVPWQPSAEIQIFP